MAKPRKLHVRGRNALLSALPRRETDRLAPLLEKVSFEIRSVVYHPGEPFTHVYFPLTGLFSLVIKMKEGTVSEVGTIGNEGMVGTPVFLGAQSSPTQAFSQAPGEAWRMSVRAFEEETQRHGALYEVVRRYTQGVLNQISQSAACNTLHSVEKRLCRWLLTTHDRMGADVFVLTQEFMAQMLGVRRASVTVVAGILQNAGLISYSRGNVTILDRRGLERTSCECYEVVRREFERLLG